MHDRPSSADFIWRYGPWAVITGASEGTGRAFALRLATQGIRCVLLARRAEPLMQLAELIHTRYGVECVAASVDLAAGNAADQVQTAVGDRDVGLFIANAGGDDNGALFVDRPASDWLALAQRNVVTTTALCHHFATAMRARGRGGLLLINSGACYGGASYLSVYAGTKAFMLCFAEGLWAELQPHGIDVLTLVLGQTDTPAFRRLLADKGLPLPASLAAPDDVARAGLEQLAHGPVHHWGLADDAAGYAPASAAARRARVKAVDRASRSLFEGSGSGSARVRS